MNTRPATVPGIASTIRRPMSTIVVTIVLVVMSAWPATLAGASTGQMASVPDPGSNQAPTALPSRNDDPEIRVFDSVQILTEGQEESLNVDLRRAHGLGIEMLVYTRMSDNSAEESQAFADQLRTEWGVESEPGADDGLVYLLTVNPAAPETNAVLISAGANTFPIRQLDQPAMQHILDSEMAPQVEEGEFNEALLFGVRRILNFAEYSPPDPPALSSLQERLNTIAVILSAGLLQLAVAGYFLVAVVREKRLAFVPSARSLAIYAVTIGITAIIVGAVAILGRSALGSLTALGVVIWSGCVVPLLSGFLIRRKERAESGLVRQRDANIPPDIADRGTPEAIGSVHG